MSETWLSPEEIEELTAAKRKSAQCRALARMGIPFRPNAVGRPLVERVVVLTGGPPKPRSRPRTEPNWDALNLPRRKK